MTAPLLQVLGGGLWQVPTIQRAKALGYRVLVTDKYAERPGYAVADAHELVDIVDYEATLRVAEKYRIAGIVCDTTDVGVPTAAYVAEKLGLFGIGFETALKFTNKFRMREVAARAGILCPQFRRARDRRELRQAAAELSFPLILKPVDSQSSRGVYRADTLAELESRFEESLACSREKSVIVEEFIEGTEVTVEGICIDGVSRVLGISDKEHYAQRKQVARRLTYPAAFSPEVLREIERTNIAVVTALGLRTGCTHAEYLVRGNSVYLVEIAARGGGSHIYSRIAPHLSGIDLPRFMIETACGRQPRVDFADLQRGANLQFLDLPAGRVSRIEGLAQARAVPGIAELMLEFKEGDELHFAEDDRARPGFVLALAGSRAEALSATQQALRALRVEVIPQAMSA